MAAARRQGRAPHPPPERHRARRLLDGAAREAQASGPSPRASRALGSRTAQGAAAFARLHSLFWSRLPRPPAPRPVPRPDADLVEMVCAPMCDDFRDHGFGANIGDLSRRKVVRSFDTGKRDKTLPVYAIRLTLPYYNTDNETREATIDALISVRPSPPVPCLILPIGFPLIPLPHPRSPYT